MEATLISISFVQLPKLCALVHSCRQRRVLWVFLGVGGVMITLRRGQYSASKRLRERAYLRMNLSNIWNARVVTGPEQYANVKAVDDETGMIRAMCGWASGFAGSKPAWPRGGGSARRKLPPKPLLQIRNPSTSSKTSQRRQKEVEMDLNRARLMAGYPAFRKVGFEDIGRLEVDLATMRTASNG
ncbi:hypothetical protein B0H13DRAFT_1884609 [Mycena leptocephala]|nr:hypothetical protein B0H13DRAFT_1884609 [Mycena leptocephala]